MFQIRMAAQQQSITAFALLAYLMLPSMIIGRPISAQENIVALCCAVRRARADRRFAGFKGRPTHAIGRVNRAQVRHLARTAEIEIAQNASKIA
jgi:hypothetical protein